MLVKRSPRKSCTRKRGATGVSIVCVELVDTVVESAPDGGALRPRLSARMVAGQSCFEPRLEPVYVCMPVRAATAGQIYALQEDFAGRYFATYEEEGAEAAALPR